MEPSVIANRGAVARDRGRPAGVGTLTAEWGWRKYVAAGVTPGADVTRIEMSLWCGRRFGTITPAGARGFLPFVLQSPACTARLLSKRGSSTMPVLSRLILIPAVVAAALGAAGCGEDEALSSTTAAKLRGLARVYLDYSVPKNGAGPADQATLSKHIKKLPEHVLAANGVDPELGDGLFVSDRDGQPFVVRYGQSIGMISGTSTQVIAHEQTGVRGKKLVTFVSGKVELADDARLQELLAPK